MIDGTPREGGRLSTALPVTTAEIKMRPSSGITSRTLLAGLALLAAPAALHSAALVPAAWAQDSADPVDPIEDQALEEEAHARFDQALDTFRRAFDTSVQQARSGGAARVKNLSRAEVLAEKIDLLTERTTRFRDSEAFLAGYDAESVGHVLRARIDFLRTRYRAAAGDAEGAAELAASLSLVHDYWIIGPFDNERGRGFKSNKEPQKELKLDAEYEGKERPVRWRRVPVTDVTARVNLNALLRPNDQAFAYAVAFVKSETAQPAAVRVGSDEALRVWWNGQEVVKRDVRRSLGWDQDVAGVNLNEGWNAVLLKVHDQTGAWAFRMRLTAPDGGPLSGVAFARTQEDAETATGSLGKATPFEGAVDGGAKQYYDGVVGEGEDATQWGGGSRDLFHLGYLHFRRGFDSITDRKAAKLLKKAADGRPGDAVLRFHYAEAASPPIEMSVEREENRQRQARLEAVEKDPEYALAYRALADYYTRSLVNLERAESLLRKALTVNPDYYQARLDLADVLRRRGLHADAQKERNRVFAQPSAAEREARQRAWARDLQRQGRGREALGAWNEVLGLDARSNDVRRRVANLAAESMAHQDAVNVLESILEVNPYDTSTLSRLAELHQGHGDLDLAATTLERALEIAPEDDGLLQTLGHVRLKSGQNDEALVAFQEALRVNPKLQKLERYLEFLDPSRAPYEDDYRTDITALIEKARDYDNAENDSHLILLEQQVDKVNPDGTSSTYTHNAMKILTNEGVKRFDRIPAQAWGDRSFKWKGARVIKEDGSVLDAKLQAFGSFRVADFPPLVPGDVVEIEYRADDRSQSFFGDYFGTVRYFGDYVPTLMATYTLITPKERTFHFNRERLDQEPVVTETEDDTRVYEWVVWDMPKIRQEIGMPGPVEIFPQVQVSTYGSWDEFAKWWWSMIRDQHIASEDIKAKVTELTAEKESRLDKVRAIYEFVTGEVTYQAWEFGVHGYKPYTTTSIFDKKEGDCKDKAILMNTMLREIGVESYPVLIMAEEPRPIRDMSLAMVGQFNHCISYVPDADGSGTGMFLDGTVQYGHVGLPPGMDRGAEVLVVKPEGAELVKIPLGTPDETGLDQDYDVTVHADGSASVKAEFTWRGDLALQCRSMFAVEGRRKLILQAILAQVFGPAKLGEIDFDDLKEADEPVERFRVTAEVRNFAKGSGDVRDLPTAFLNMLDQMKQIVERPEREHDLLLQNPMSFCITAKYTLPEGWTLDQAPEDLSIDLPQAAFTSTASADGSVLTLERNIELRETRVPTESYGAFRDGLTKANGTSKHTFKVRVGGTEPDSGPEESGNEDSDTEEDGAEEGE